MRIFQVKCLSGVHICTRIVLMDIFQLASSPPYFSFSNYSYLTWEFSMELNKIFHILLDIIPTDLVVVVVVMMSLSGNCLYGGDKDVPKRWGIPPDSESGGIRLSLVIVDSHLLTGVQLKGGCRCPQLTYCRPLSSCSSVGWLGSVAVECWTCNREVAGSTQAGALSSNNSGQVVHTHVPL